MVLFRGNLIDFSLCAASMGTYELHAGCEIIYHEIIKTNKDQCLFSMSTLVSSFIHTRIIELFNLFMRLLESVEIHQDILFLVLCSKLEDNQRTKCFKCLKSRKMDGFKDMYKSILQENFHQQSELFDLFLDPPKQIDSSPEKLIERLALEQLQVNESNLKRIASFDLDLKNSKGLLSHNHEFLN
jgi:hypothetical protein